MKTSLLKIILVGSLSTALAACGTKKEEPEVTGVATTVSASNSTITGTGPVVADGVATSTVTITLKDAASAPVVGVTPKFGATGTGNTYGACPASDANGESICVIKSTKAETKTLAITWPVSKSDGTVVFEVGAPAKLCFTTQPGGGVAGTTWSQQPVVAIGDSTCNIVTSATDSVTLTVSTGAGALIGTATVSAVGGIATFSGLSMTNAADAKKLSAAASGLTTGVSNSFNITAAAATQLAFSTQPSGGVAGTAWPVQPVVEARDTYGNKAVSANGTVLLGLSTGTGTLAGGNSRNLVNGVATFSGLSLNLVGSDKVLTAASSGLTSATTNSFTIIAGTAAKLGFSTQPGGGVSNTAWAQQPVVEVQDSSGNRVTSSTASITLALTAGTGALTGTVTATAVAGLATFSGLRVDLVGTNKVLTASSSGLTSGASNNFTITPGTANKLGFTTQPGGGIAGAVWAQQPVVQILDAAGNLVTSSTATVTLTLTTGTGTVTGTRVLAAVGGVATYSGLSLNLVGTNKILTASATSMTAAVSNSFTITHGTATKLAFTTQPGGGQASAVWAQQPVVEVRDANNNPVLNSNVVITVARASGTGTLAGTTFMNAASGVATFTNLTLSVTGTKTLNATSPGLTTATSSSFDILPAAATQLAFTTQPGGGVSNTVWAQQPVVQIRDAAGNIMTTATDPVTIVVNTGTGTIGGTATVNAVAGVATFGNLTMNLIGAKTVRATATGLTAATSASFNITAGLTSAASSVVASPSSLFADGVTTSTVTVTLTDAGGNPLAGKNVTLTSSRGATDTITGSPATSDASGVATFTVTSSTAGSPNFTADCTTDTVTLSTTPTISFQSALADATQSTWSISPVTLPNDNSSTATVRVTVKNATGTALAGKSVTLTSSRGASDTITTSPAVTDSSGNASFTVRSATRGEPTLTLAVSTDSVTITNQAKLIFYDVAPYSDWQSRLADSSATKMAPGLNSSATSTWVDLYNLGPFNGTLNGFNFNTSSGWCGDGTTSISACTNGPYRLNFDGSNDYVNFGTNANSFSSVSYESWLRAANPTLKGRVILANGDTSNRGLTMRQAWDATGRIELNTGVSKSYASEITDDSPLVFYKLDETSGTTATAVIGTTNGTHATVTVNSGTALNENRASATYNGTTSSTSSGNVYEGTNDQTVEAWVYPSSVSGTRGIVSKISTTRGYSLELVNGKASFRLLNSLGLTEVVTGTTTLSTNTWYHIVGVRNSTTGRIYIYVNGQEEANSALSGTAIGTSTTNFYIGRNAATYFSGRIDEVAVYTSALSAARITAHYDARNVATCYSSTLLSNAAWRHVVSTFDGATGDMKLYVNATLECTRSATGTTHAGTTAPLAMGTYVSTGGTPLASTYWPGAVGDVRVYNSVLTNTNITNNRSATSARFP